MSPHLITIIAGGTGSVKLVRGIAQLTDDISVIANVADNIWLYGMYVCPDIDTLVYGLAGILDEKRGWGIKGDTFSFLDQLKKTGADTWFGLGDRDLATHVLRTDMMKHDRQNLTQVTAYFTEKFGVGAKILPVTDSDVQTMIITDIDTNKMMHLQEFWVKNAGRPEVKGIEYIGINTAYPTKQALEAINSADKIILAPGNPVSSIGPTLALLSVKKALAERRQDVVAVSPIIGDSAISGPAAKYLSAVGVEATATGVADFYQEVVGSMVIDKSDHEAEMERITRLGMEVYETNIIMQGRLDEVDLGRYLLDLHRKS